MTIQEIAKALELRGEHGNLIGYARPVGERWAVAYRDQQGQERDEWVDTKDDAQRFLEILREERQ